MMSGGLRSGLMRDHGTAHHGQHARRKRRELMIFGFLALVLAPILAVLVVAGFGFVVWMYQLIAGPPGPPQA